MFGPHQVILTSFRDRANWKGIILSVARWNPRDMAKIPRVPFLAPIYDGQDMVHLVPDDFRKRYERILTQNGDNIEHFLRTYQSYDLTLLCWCNPDRQKKYPKLYCHRILIGYYIEEYYPQIKVVYLDGAENPVWERRK